MEEQRGYTCCFTGHRSAKLPWKDDENDPACLELKKKLCDIVEALAASGVNHFICGMALGCDSYFAEAVINVRKTHPDILLEAAIPCEDQDRGWKASERRRYKKLLESCDIKTFVSKEYSRDCMRKRNYYMVDNSSILVAVFDGHYGGTFQTVNYAKRSGLHVIEVSP